MSNLAYTIKKKSDLFHSVIHRRHSPTRPTSPIKKKPKKKRITEGGVKRTLNDVVWVRSGGESKGTVVGLFAVVVIIRGR